VHLTIRYTDENEAIASRLRFSYDLIDALQPK